MKSYAQLPSLLRVLLVVFPLVSLQTVAQSPLPSSRQGVVLSNSQSAASEKWISLFAPKSLSSTYRLIFPSTAPAANQMLSILNVSGTDDSLTWVNGISGSGTATQLAFWNSGSTLSSSSNLYWDNSSFRLGLGTSSPGQRLELMNGNLLLSNNNNTASELRLAEPSSGGSHYIGFKAPALGSSTTYTLPSADGSANASLVTNGSGTLSWASTGIQLFARKTSDQLVSNSTTLVDDNDLQMSIGANEVWEVNWMLRVTGSAGDFQFAVTIPSGATMWITARGDADDSNDDYGELTTSGSALQLNNAMSISDTGTLIELKGIVTNSSTAGTVKLRWSQAVANATATRVKAPSYLHATRLQ